jgi:tartrate-resistant acid phosphatase type 5
MKNKFFITLVLIIYACIIPESGTAQSVTGIYYRKAGTDYLEVIAIGDAGRGNTGQMNTALAMNNYAENIPIDFVLYLGDNSYSSGFSSVYDEKWKTRFEDIYDYPALDVPFYTLLGNHDYVGNVDAQLEYSSMFDTKFTLPAKYYSFKHVLTDSIEILFIMLDTIILLKGGSEAETELNWFVNELSSSKADWKIVAGHYPLYSNGSHGNKEALIEIIEPVLLDYNADLYIAGHDHNLELLKNDTGPYYIVSGSGALLRNFTPGRNTLYGKSERGVAVLRFSANELVIMFLLENNSIDYTFKITK